jgi:hypothetical protein
VPRPRLFVNEEVHNRNDNAERDIEVRYFKIDRLITFERAMQSGLCAPRL